MEDIGRSSGWRDEAVRLEPYDDRWPRLFAAEAEALDRVIGSWITGGIHHVGSTAVPGLAAKPIIDIAVGVADLESSRACIALLADLDYRYAPYLVEVMHWFASRIRAGAPIICTSSRPARPGWRRNSRFATTCGLIRTGRANTRT